MKPNLKKKSAGITIVLFQINLLFNAILKGSHRLEWLALRALKQKVGEAAVKLEELERVECNIERKVKDPIQMSVREIDDVPDHHKNI